MYFAFGKFFFESFIAVLLFGAQNIRYVSFGLSSLSSLFDVFLVGVFAGAESSLKVTSIDSQSSLASTFELASSITGFAVTVAVSTHGVDEVEEGSGGGTEVGGEAILFFSKNFSFLAASLRKTLGDFFFNLDPWLECPVRLVEEKSAEKLNLEPPRLTSRAAFPAFSSVMYLARSKHLSKIKGGKNGVNVDMVESSNQSIVERFLDLSHISAGH